MFLRNVFQTRTAVHIRNEKFLNTLEEFVSSRESINYKLTAAEINAYFNEFDFEILLNSLKKAKIHRISINQLRTLVYNTGDYSVKVLVHQDKGFFYQKQSDEKFRTDTTYQENVEYFDFTDALYSLDKRMTFMTFVQKEGIFEVQEIFVYIPAENDILLHSDCNGFSKENFAELITRDSKKIDYIVQGKNIFVTGVSTPEEVKFDLEKEFFIFTKMKIQNSTIVIHNQL